MQVNRHTILDHLTNYLEGRLEKEDVYAWALSVAVSDDFERLSKNEEVIGKTIYALIDINHDDLKKIPTRKMLEYYRRCLAGEAVYAPLESRNDLDKLDIPDFLPETETARSAETDGTDFEEEKPFRLSESLSPWILSPSVLMSFRIYVVIFAVCSIGVHLLSILDPGFMSFEEHPAPRGTLMVNSIPHLIYALLLLLPPRFLARRSVFFLSFPALIFGMLYYWHISVSLISKLALNFLLIFVILPFSAIPATFALFLLLLEREWLEK